MAVNPEWVLRSPGQYQDTDGSNAVTVITGTGAPDGSADPFDSALKGSRYIRSIRDDDYAAVYLKVDESSSDDDWQLMLVANCLDAHDIDGDWEWQTDKKVAFRDGCVYIYSPAATVGALALDASGDTWRIGDMAASNYLSVNFLGELSFTGSGRINARGAFEVFDDFAMQQTWVEAETPWILNSGNDAQAIDPAISTAERGVCLITTGDNDGTTAEDGAQLVCHVPVQADSGGLVFECRLHINTAITNVSVNVGLTDVTTLEEPFTNAADVITSNATDAVCLVYDTSATTDEWWMCAVDSDADDTGNAATGTAPVADTYQKLRIEVSANGNSVKYYIDDVLEGTLTNAGVSPDVNLYATVIACGDGTASKTVDVDYIYVGHNR